MSKKLTRIVAILLFATILLSTTADASRGAAEYIKSEEVLDRIYIAINKPNQENKKNIKNSEKNLSPRKKQAEKLKRTKEKTTWDVDDIVSMYREGYAINDIGTAMKLSQKIDTKPFELLERKGKANGIELETSKKAEQIDINEIVDFSETQGKQLDKTKKKSWKTAVAEATGDKIAANADMQKIKENGLMEFIDPSVFSEEELEYLNSEEVIDEQNISLMSLNSSIDDNVIDAYNNRIFPGIKYDQYNAGEFNNSNDEVEINPITRNATVRATDISLKGKNGLDLNLTRVNSTANTGDVTPMLRRTSEDLTIETKTFYSVTGYARVEVKYNEPLPNGEYIKTFDSQKIVFKAYDYKFGVQTNYDIAGISALHNDYALLEKMWMPHYMVDSEEEALDIQEKAMLGKYDKTYSLSEDSKIRYVKFTVYDDPILIRVNYEGSYPVYSNLGETYYTDCFDYNLTDKYFDIGIGWEFDFPYIEKLYSNTSNTEYGADYLHFGSKGVWRITDDYELEDYYLNDLSISYGGRFNGLECWVTVTEKDGKKYYFGELGQLYGIEDRFGNNIKFQYNTRYLYDGHNYPYQLTKIIDTVGREITLDYSNPLQTIVTVHDKNDSSQNRVIKYNKTLVDSAGEDYHLTSVVDSEGNETIYEYEKIRGSTSLSSKDLDDGLDTYVNYHYIRQIFKPSKLNIKLTTPFYTRNCGTDGIAKKPEVIRYEYKEPKNTSLSSFSGYSSREIGASSPVPFDGYPRFNSSEEIPNEIVIRVYTTEHDKDGEARYIISEYKKSENGNWLCETKTTYAEVWETYEKLWRERVEYEYNELEQCIKETYKKYPDPKDMTVYQTNVVEYTYDKYNNLLKVKYFEDEEYSVNYEYDSTYHLMTKKTFKKDFDTTITENYTLTDDKKSIAKIEITENNITKRKREYTYDTYGNMISEKRYTGENSWNDFISVGYSYDDLSSNINKINGVNLSKIYITGVKDADGNLVNALNGGTAGTIEYQYTYDWFGNILTEKDSNGNVYTYTYDKINRPIELKNPSQGTIKLSYGLGAMNNYVQVTDENGNIMKYTYFSYGDLKEEKDVTRDKVLKTYEYVYNASPECLRTNIITYSDYGNTVTETMLEDGLGRITEKEIRDSEGNALYREEYTYEWAVDNEYDRITKTVKGKTEADDYILKQYIDKFGNLSKEEVIYKNNGVDESIITEYTYDYVGNLISVKSPRATAEGWTGNQHMVEYEYDIDGQITKTKDIYGNYSVNEYDGLGRRIRSADAEATASSAPYYSTYYYDALGRLLKEETPIDNTSYAQSKYYYDNNGNVIKSMVKNGSGADDYSETLTEYDWRNNPVKVLTEGADSAYYYDAVGNVLRMYTGELTDFTINGLDDVNGAEYEVTKYTYDTKNRVISITDALGKTVSNTYDINGNLVKTTDKNQSILNYVYDKFGNMIERSVQSGEGTEKEEIYTYTYNQKNLLITMTGNGVTNTYTYDNMGRLLKEEITGGIVKEYSYDNNGNRTLFKLTKDNIEQINTVYTYDKLDRVQTITNGENVSTYSYDRNGNLLAETTNGYTTSYSYNKGGLVTGLTTQKDTTAIQNHSYSYYPDGNILQKESTVGLKTSQYNYLYDNAGRLIKETLDQEETSYTYDAFGNRATEVKGDMVKSYTYDLNNRLLTERHSKEDSGIERENRYYYDDNGNLLKKQELSFADTGIAGIGLGTISESTVSEYTYNRNNQLIGYRDAQTTASYSYDGNNLRQSKTVNGVTTNHIWDGSNIVMELNGANTNKYYRGVNGIAYASINGTLSYYHKDSHGDVVALTDSTGAITKNYQFDAFGNEMLENDNDTNPFRYCGEYYDTETGLIYLRNRYYDTVTGRFITEDPVKDGLNWYVYCANNPVMFVDPSGESIIVSSAAFIIGCTIVSALGNGTAQVAINYATGQPWNADLANSLVSGAASGAVFGATLNPQYASITGTLVTTGWNVLEGIYNGDSATDITIGVVEDVAWGAVSYKADKLVGAFIKTNNGWFQPKRLRTFFTKAYGQQIIRQTIAAGAITATSVSMYENGKRNVKAIQEFLEIDVDGSYGPKTKSAVKGFQQELINAGYLKNGEDDGMWGPKTDEAFRNYVKDNVVFIQGN